MVFEEKCGRFCAEDRPILSVGRQVPPEAVSLGCPPQAPTSCLVVVCVLKLYWKCTQKALLVGPVLAPFSLIYSS